MQKPNTCKEIGCAGISCIHYKPKEDYPYYECQYFINKEKNKSSKEK